MKLTKILWIFTLFAFSFATQFQVDSTRDNQVIFYASSTFGNFSGETNSIEGNITWESEDTLRRSQIYFEVPLDSIDTGIGLRNNHMRNKYLETDKYPKAIYEGQIIEWKKTGENVYLIESSGTLNIHGTEKSFPLKATLAKTQEGYRLMANFKLDITNFNIEQPKFLLTSMNKEIRLRIITYLSK